VGGAAPATVAVCAGAEIVVPRWLLVTAAFALTVWEPIQVLPRIGLAPGYSLLAQDGSHFTSESSRGSVTLYTFSPLECGSPCDSIEATMHDVQERVPTEVDLGSTDFLAVTIVLDPIDDPQLLAGPAARSGADGERWRWVGGGETDVKTLVGSGFHRSYDLGATTTEGRADVGFDPGFVLVDGAGIIRGDYRFQTTVADADKLVGHIRILADEIRNATGLTAVAYEAAHLFLCYP
jgi:protein SCO1/2